MLLLLIFVSVVLFASRIKLALLSLLVCYNPLRILHVVLITFPWISLCSYLLAIQVMMRFLQLWIVSLG